MIPISKKYLMFSKNLSLIILFSLFSVLGFSQAQQGQTYLIAGLTAEGNEFVGKQTIISLSGLEVGMTFQYPFDEKITAAVDRLWKRRQFKDVRIEVERITSEGIFLVIIVQENPRLNDIIIKNNDELTDDEIRDEIKKSRGDIITGQDIYEIKKTILDLYEEDGLNFAEVNIEQYDSDTLQYVNLEIYIEEGNEFRVKEIVFNGANNFSQADLKGAFDETSEKSWWKIWKSSKFKEEDYEKDLDFLREFFRTEGYIDAEILGDTIIYDIEEEEVKIEIDIDEGNQVYIREIDFRGNTVFTDNALKQRLEMNRGDVYNIPRFDMNLNLNEKQTDAKSLYNNNGYLFADFYKQERRVGEDSVDIIIDVFENERAQVRKVNIIGNEKTKDKVIRRELFVRPGEYFSRAAIIRSVNALNVLGYFNPENLRPDVRPVPGDNTKVDVEFSVEERSTDTFNASVGYAGTFGFTGSFGLTFNNFALLEPLKGGGGEVLNFNWEFGFQNLQRFSLGYTKPWLLDEPTTVGFSIFDSRINFITNFRQTGIAFNVGRRFKWPDDYFRGNWSLRLQQNDIDDSGGNTLYRPGEYSEITVGQTISRTSIDNQFFATTGSNFQLQTNFAMASIGIGGTDYIKNEINFDTYNTLAKITDQNKVVLYMGSQLGYITGLVNDTTISPIELYRMGGNALGGINVTPLRGYDDRSINSTGGKIMAKFTTELRVAISLNPMPIFVYAFGEAGNVWDELTESNPFNLNRSAGVGLQMFLNPIGIIGFSYGYGFDPVPGTSEPFGWKFLIHVGQF